MSFILDALRKSEAARRRHEAPDLFAQTVHAAPPPSATAPMGPGKTAYALATLGLGALVLALWLTFGRPPPAADDASTDAHDQGGSAASADDSTQNRPVAPGDPTGAGDERPNAAHTDPFAHHTRDPAPVANAPMPPSRSEALPPASAPPVSAPPTASASLSPPPAAPATRSMPATRPPESDLTSGFAPVPASAIPTPPDDAAPLRIGELDPGARKQLPPLKMSLHLWNETAAQRVVVLDGQRLGEGDMLGDVMVERIARDGVILSWRGSRLKLDVR